MNVELLPESRRLIQKRLESGEYATAADVVAAALRALDQIEGQDQLSEEVLDAIDEAEAQLARGEGYTVEEVRQISRSWFDGK